jgi:hypothetical protein
MPLLVAGKDNNAESGTLTADGDDQLQIGVDIRSIRSFRFGLFGVREFRFCKSEDRSFKRNNMNQT